ncbi:PKD domain-containing protein, partial [candidate division KSB1 bacterium]|nr:PKD domain-containing protein [candidate division KSB1 bacterium]
MRLNNTRKRQLLNLFCLLFIFFVQSIKAQSSESSTSIREFSIDLGSITSKSLTTAIIEKNQPGLPVQGELIQSDLELLERQQTMAWSTIMTETFEGSWPASGWTTSSNYTNGTGTPITWAPETYHKYAGTKSAFPHGSAMDPAINWSYTANPGGVITSQMIYGPFNLSDASDANLTFMLSYQLGAGDQVVWLASTNGTNFYGSGYSGGSIYPNWTSITFDLKSVPTLGNICGQSAVYIMLLYNADDVQDFNEAAYIDNISLQKDVVVPPPVANFSGSPTSGTAPLAVNFTDASTGSITSRSWNFGDGGTSASTSPSHTYSSGGTYTVSLTVTGPGGSDTETKSNYITATSPTPPPVANFSGSPTSGIAPLAVNFTDACTGSICSSRWSFGDGGTSTST